MTLAELKQILQTEPVQIPEDLLIFECEENWFLAKQYTNYICELTNKIPNFINNIAETVDSAIGLVFDYQQRLNILETDTFDEKNFIPNEVKNTIVICNKIDKKLRSQVEDYIVYIPKTPDWAIKSYIQKKNNNLTITEIDWLFDAAKGDIYKICNELDKLAGFKPEEQQEIFEAMRFSPETDLYNLVIFDLVKAILNKDYSLIYDWLKHNNNNNGPSFDPIALVTNLLSVCKQLIYIMPTSGMSETDHGIKKGRIYYIKKDYKAHSEEQLRKKN